MRQKRKPEPKADEWLCFDVDHDCAADSIVTVEEIANADADSACAPNGDP